MPGIALESPVIGTGIADLEVNFRSISEQRLFRGYQYFTDNDMAKYISPYIPKYHNAIV